VSFDPRQSNPAGIMLALVTIGGLFGALYMGQMVAHNDFIKIGMLAAGAVAMTICLMMGQKIWMLIPLCWSLTGKISVLPLPLNVRDLGVLAAFGMLLVFYIFKKAPKSASLNRYDLLLYINLAYLVTVYARNPVGTQAFGSEIVGGRPYFDVLIAVLAFWVFQHVVLSPKESRMFPILMSFGSLVVGILGVLTQRIPALVPLVAPFYSGISVGSYLEQQNNGQVGESYRIDSLGGMSLSLGGALAAFFRPVSLMLFLKPFWSVLFYISVLSGLLAGFRSGLISLAVILLLSSYFYNGLKDVIRIGLVMLLGVIFIIGLQGSGVPVHPAAQRALSFIPGPWDPDVVAAAEGSSEWRFEMWRIALEGDKYIHNKILGDGFGFNAYELAIQMQAAWGGQGYVGGNQGIEAQLVTGAFHSGPISAIRYVGIVGLMLFTVLMIACATYAWRTINLCKGTPFFPMALFVGIPIIYKPIEYWFVFGGFDGDFPKVIFGLACVNLVSRTLAAYREKQSAPKQVAEFAPPQSELPVPAAGA